MEEYYNTLYRLSGDTTMADGKSKSRTIYDKFDSHLVEYKKIIDKAKGDNLDTIINLDGSIDKIFRVASLYVNRKNKQNLDTLRKIITFLKEYKKKEYEAFNGYVRGMLGVVEGDRQGANMKQSLLNTTIGKFQSLPQQQQPQQQQQQQPPQPQPQGQPHKDGFKFLELELNNNMRKFVLKHFSPIRAMIIYLKFCLFGMIVNRDAGVEKTIADRKGVINGWTKYNNQIQIYKEQHKLTDDAQAREEYIENLLKDADQKMNDVLSGYKRIIAGKITNRTNDSDIINYRTILKKHTISNIDNNSLVNDFAHKFSRGEKIRVAKIVDTTFGNLPRIIYFVKSYQHMHKIMNLKIEGNDDLIKRIRVITGKVYPMVLDAVRGENREQERMRLVEMISIIESKLELVDDTKFEEDNVFDNEHREKQQQYYADIIVNIIKNIHNPEGLKSELQKLYVDEKKTQDINKAINDYGFGIFSDVVLEVIGYVLDNDDDIYGKMKKIFKRMGIKLPQVLHDRKPKDINGELLKIKFDIGTDNVSIKLKGNTKRSLSDELYVNIFNALGGLNHGKVERECAVALGKANAKIEGMEQGGVEQIRVNEAKIQKLGRERNEMEQENDKLKERINEEEGLKQGAEAELAEAKKMMDEKIDKQDEEHEQVKEELIERVRKAEENIITKDNEIAALGIQLEGLRRDINKIKQEIAIIEKENENLRENNNLCNENLIKCEKELGDAKKLLNVRGNKLMQLFIRIKELEKEIEELKKQLKSKEEEFDSSKKGGDAETEKLRGEIDALKAQIQKKEREMVGLQGETDVLKQQIKKSETDTGELEGQIEQLTKDKRESESKLEDLGKIMTEEINKRDNEHKQKTDDLVERVKEAEKQKNDEIALSVVQIKRIKGENEKLQEGMSLVGDEIESQKEFIKDLTEEKKGLEKAKEVLEKEKTEWIKKEIILEGAKEALEKNKTKLEKDKTKLEKDKKTCEEAKDVLKKTNKDCEEARKVLEREKTACEEEKKKLKGANKDCEEAKNELSKIINQKDVQLEGIAVYNNNRLEGLKKTHAKDTENLKKQCEKEKNDKIKEIEGKLQIAESKIEEKETGEGGKVALRREITALHEAASVWDAQNTLKVQEIIELKAKLDKSEENDELSKLRKENREQKIKIEGLEQNQVDETAITKLKETNKKYGDRSASIRNAIKNIKEEYKQLRGNIEGVANGTSRSYAKLTLNNDLRTPVERRTAIDVIKDTIRVNIKQYMDGSMDKAMSNYIEQIESNSVKIT